MCNARAHTLLVFPYALETCVILNPALTPFSAPHHHTRARGQARQSKHCERPGRVASCGVIVSSYLLTRRATKVFGFLMLNERFLVVKSAIAVITNHQTANHQITKS